MNTLSKIIDYESGVMGEEEVVEMFQEMIDNGLVWQLQGHYGRTAMDLINAGLCSPRCDGN